MHFGQDGLGDFDWSNKADDTLVSLALMATNSEVPYCSKCSKSYKKLLESYQTEKEIIFKKQGRNSRYQMSLESLEVILKTHERTNMHGVISMKQMEYDLKSRDLKLEEKQKELDQAIKERDDFKVKLEKWSNASVLQNEVLNKQGIDELAIRNKVLNQENTKSSQPEIDRNKVIIEDWVDSDDEETDVSEIQKNTVLAQKIVPSPKKTFIPSADTYKGKDWKVLPDQKTDNAVLSQSTGRPYHPRMDNIRPRTSSFSPSSRSSTTRTPHRPQRPKKIVKSIWVKKGSTVGSSSTSINCQKECNDKSKTNMETKRNYLDSVNRDNGSYTLKQFEYVTPLGVSKSVMNLGSLKSKFFEFCPGNPEEDLKDYAIIDSGCSGSMTGDKDKLSDFKEFKGGYVAFGNDSKGGRISGKGTIKTSCLDFEKVSYVEELKFNLLSVSQICDKKHNVLFTDKECLILSPKFKFVDEDLATEDEAVLWHRRLGHVNFKNINKLVKGNLVRGLPSKTFKLDHSFWVFFLAYKDETYDMLHDLIVGLENKLRHKVKTIRCDHGTEFKNQLMNEFCAKKGIKREYSIARTPQQNGVAERKNRTLIEAARTMLADSQLHSFHEQQS
ncbi:putative ribonuclease H-like domain-containing protein [Tanacetum coccineum]